MRETETERERYHHGDLRRALLDAALELIRTRGLDALSLRAVARAAGVSHAAPYHHFADRRALLAAVAEEGFHALTAAMLERVRAVPAPAARLQESGVAYVLFAIRHPAHFRVMFSPELAEPLDQPALRGAALASYEVLGASLRLCQEAGLVRGGDPGVLSRAAWAQVHGLATLLLDGYFGAEGRDEVVAERMAREVTDLLWEGLRVIQLDRGDDRARR
jgi:AcrR family transcriptional regulator